MASTSEIIGESLEKYKAKETRKKCGRCHTCGTVLMEVLDGEEWCPKCGAYRRYPSHGWCRGKFSDKDEECPDWTVIDRN
ncbi:MAG: hypothetical protein QXQ43_03725 [Nitrososphaerota archaeon]